MCDDDIHQGLIEDPTVSRRTFGLMTVAAAGLTAASAHAAAPVVEKDIEIKTPDGLADAALYYPEGKGAWPAVLLWPDVLSLRPVFREMGKRLAASGYVVLVPNLYYRVKKAPVDKVILVGTGSTESPSTSSSSSADLGTTVPAGEVQSWAHQYLLDNGYSEADFTAANYIINHESGWSPTATNPTSGAYGLGQAYPGSKMASAGADWQTNYKTQFKWFISYCEQRYGGIVAAYNYWIAHNNY